MGNRPEGNNYRHGMSGTPEYKAWIDAKRRCYKKTARRYRDWGGRGIRMCEEWLHDFNAFYNYIGPRPSSEHSLDRIDNNKNYEPGNVRWATYEEQSRNQRMKYNRTGFTGVSISTNGRYIAQINWDGKQRYLGLFDTPEEAHQRFLDEREKLRNYES